MFIQGFYDFNGVEKVKNTAIKRLYPEFYCCYPRSSALENYLLLLLYFDLKWKNWID